LKSLNIENGGNFEISPVSKIAGGIRNLRIMKNGGGDQISARFKMATALKISELKPPET